MPAVLFVSLLALSPSPVLAEPLAQEVYISAQDQWLDALGACENPEWPQLRRIVDTNGYYSYGPLMFQWSTWKANAPLVGLIPDKQNIYDEDAQRRTAAYMLDHGGAGNWYTCAKIVKKRLGPWPVDNATTLLPA